MKTIYFDCSMGVAGDMLVAALLELTENLDLAVEKLNQMGLPGVRFETETLFKCGIKATHVHVLVHGVEEGETHHHKTDDQGLSGQTHHHEMHGGEVKNSDHTHQHRSLQDVEQIINALSVSDSVKQNAIAVYKKIAEAESVAHDVSVSEVHFHEVGMLDAIADVTAVCYLLEELRPVHIYASPIHVGAGTAETAHGILPVPAPATAYLLQNIPTYSDGVIQAELATPTGAALLAHFVEDFIPQPMMRMSRIGCGCGTKDFAKANILRAFLGEMSGNSTMIYELSCNLDDCTGEEIGFATERLFAAGALDVYTTNISMKKNRPAVKLSVLCRSEQREEMRQLLFMYTSTLGIREQTFIRYELEREVENVETPYGSVRIKRATGYGISKEKYEYEDLARIAKEQNASIQDVLKILGREN